MTDRKKPSRAAWFGSIALLVIVSGIHLFIPVEGDVDGMPYRVGRMVGVAFIGTLIGYFLWWLTRRTHPPGTPKWSPYVFMVAAGFALLNVLPSLVD